MSAFVGTLQIRTFDTSAACADINIARQYVYNRMFIRVNDKTQENTAQQRRFIFPPSTTCCSTQHHQPMKSRHFYFYPIIVVLCHLS